MSVVSIVTCDLCGEKILEGQTTITLEMKMGYSETWMKWDLHSRCANHVQKYLADGVDNYRDAQVSKRAKERLNSQ